MRATGPGEEEENARAPPRTKNRLARLGKPLRMPRWMPDEGEGWILIIHAGGKAIYVRDDL